VTAHNVPLPRRARSFTFDVDDLVRSWYALLLVRSPGWPWCAPTPHSRRTRGPVIASAARVGWAAEYLALAASRTFGTTGEKGAPAAGLARIRRLLRVVIQLASFVFGGTQSAEIDADGFLSFTFLPVPNRYAASRAGEEESHKPSQSSATSERASGSERWDHRGDLVTRTLRPGSLKATNSARADTRLVPGPISSSDPI
jgi:hypothetical protein